jgi:hypothetical protein
MNLKLRLKELSDKSEAVPHNVNSDQGIFEKLGYGLSATLRGVKEFGSMGAGRLYRQKAALLKRGLFIEKRNPVTGALLSTEARPLVSDRGRYAGIYHRLANKGAGSPNLPPWKQDVAVGAKLQSPYDGRMQHALRYDDVMQKHERKMRGFSSLRGANPVDRPPISV